MKSKGEFSGKCLSRDITVRLYPCLDSIELHEVQQKLCMTNNKLAMVLDVANIVLWKWDLVNHSILCDVNRLIEFNGLGKHVTDEQLSVPDLQYFAKIFKGDREWVEEPYRDLQEGRSKK